MRFSIKTITRQWQIWTTKTNTNIHLTSKPRKSCINTWHFPEESKTFSVSFYSGIAAIDKKQSLFNSKNRKHSLTSRLSRVRQSGLWPGLSDSLESLHWKTDAKPSLHNQIFRGKCSWWGMLLHFSTSYSFKKGKSPHKSVLQQGPGEKRP